MGTFAICLEEKENCRESTRSFLCIVKKLLIALCLIFVTACSTQSKNKVRTSKEKNRPITAIENRFHDRH
ncbi:MAG: hypothetical protein HYV97_03645 [Bdellovibrio sp.]|nr:hypothetical protein [Bdellovibrio sp.]